MYYLIVNKTKRNSQRISGDFPAKVVEDLLNQGDKLLVFSYYSHTIKVPFKTELNGIVEWEWEDYPMPGGL